MSALADTVNPFLGVPLGRVGPRPRHLFGVVTWGCTATMWVAKALNSHPEILCRHAGNLHVRPRDADQLLDGVEYMWLLAREGSAYAAVGDVHGVSRAAIPAIRDTFGDDFSAAVLVREPMSRLASQLAHFAKFVGTENYEVSYVDDLVERHELRLPTGSYEERLFVHGVNMLNAITEEVAVGPIYRTEDITADVFAFASLVDYLTAGVVSKDESWLSQALSMPRVNQHARAPLSLERWQIEVIRRVVANSSWERYADLGYEPPDLESFLLATP